MNTVQVRASGNYDVLIGAGILPSLGFRIREMTRASRICIVSDSHVWPLYGSAVTGYLEEAGFFVHSFIFPAGEASKNGQTYLQLLSWLTDCGMTRSDCIVALGGGVTGDLSGFAAATYLRGIPYVQVPTTLLAAVDSSVGGKTAIDLPGGKNLAGAFYQPVLVLCDTDTLTTLPEEIFLDGCAEVIKYGVLYDAELFAHLQHYGPGFHREAVITRCVELKRDVVAEDEFDRGSRMKLNLGHTFGHSVEAASNYAVSHGKAVAIGMSMIARAFPCPDSLRIIHCLEKFGLPVTTHHSAETLLEFLYSDKKRSGGTVSLIVPREIGHCDIVPTPVENLKSLIQAGL